MSKARELLDVLEAKEVKFWLNGDGMTNVSPDVDTVSSGSGKWHFKMGDKDFKKYLKAKGVVLKGKDLLDDEDDYKYGEVS